MVGRVVSHYKILEKLGGGGMGVVYKAEDTRLKRTVALKFLPAAFSLDADAKARFKNEAEAASALQHSNICTVHDIDETGDRQSFIVMDFYEGETLKKKIERGPLPLHDAIDIALQVARGLQAAHEAGMVHRDIKPANIMVTSKGEAKILDFGLAKLAGQAVLTKTGSTVGTAAYVSPEQARGEEVDRRSDIFSLGVVLYEMITGHRPFRGEHEAAITYSLMNETPEPLARYKADVPEELQRVMNKSLAKERGDRYQHIDEMLVDLRKAQQESPAFPKAKRRARNILLLIGAGIAIGVVALVVHLFLSPKPLPAGAQSVAVLPFADMSPHKDQDYFCDGITEDIINRLSNVQGLRVPARTSVFTFKGRPVDIKDVGEKLNVQTVLEGSVQKSGDRLRITAQLINVGDGYHLWSDKYDREMKDVFDIQDEISTAIVAALRFTLTSREHASVTKHGTSSPEAFELYFKGKKFRYTERPREMLQARDYFQEAILKDPSYAAAHAGLAEDYMVLGLYSVLPRDEAAHDASQAAQTALALDKNSSEAHVSNGVVKMVFDWDWEGAEQEFKEALANNPGSFDAHREYALLLLRTHRYDESEQEFVRSQELDPLNALPLRDLIKLYLCMGQADKAEALQRKFERSDLFMARDRTSVEGVKRIIDEEGRYAYYLVDLARVYYQSGHSKEASKLIEELEARYYKNKQGNDALSLADYICNVLNDKGQALSWLERAAEERAPQLINVSYINFFPSLQKEPRFQAVLRKVGFK